MNDAQEFNELPDFKPLQVHCTDAKCGEGLHCFSPNRRKKDWQKSYRGECRECGVQLVDWDRVKARNLSDVKGVFEQLKHELIRHVFFHAEFDVASKAEAKEHGLAVLKAMVRPHLRKKIGPETIFRDGTQTKKDGSAIHYAQHATATCCRKCLEYWYGIGRGHELTELELDYCEGVVQAYLDERAPELFTPSTALSEPPHDPS